MTTINDLLAATEHAAHCLKGIIDAIRDDDSRPDMTPRDELLLARDMLLDDIHDDPDYHSPLTADLLDSITNFIDPDYDLYSD